MNIRKKIGIKKGDELAIIMQPNGDILLSRTIAMNCDTMNEYNLFRQLIEERETRKTLIQLSKEKGEITTEQQKQLESKEENNIMKEFNKKIQEELKLQEDKMKKSFKIFIQHIKKGE